MPSITAAAASPAAANGGTPAPPSMVVRRACCVVTLKRPPPSTHHIPCLPWNKASYLISSFLWPASVGFALVETALAGPINGRPSGNIPAPGVHWGVSNGFSRLINLRLAGKAALEERLLWKSVIPLEEATLWEQPGKDRDVEDGPLLYRQHSGMCQRWSTNLGCFQGLWVAEPRSAHVSLWWHSVEAPVHVSGAVWLLVEARGGDTQVLVTAHGRGLYVCSSAIQRHLCACWKQSTKLWFWWRHVAKMCSISGGSCTLWSADVSVWQCSTGIMCWSAEVHVWWWRQALNRGSCLLAAVLHVGFLNVS